MAFLILWRRMYVCMRIYFRAAAYSLNCHVGTMVSRRLYRTLQSLVVVMTSQQWYLYSAYVLAVTPVPSLSVQPQTSPGLSPDAVCAYQPSTRTCSAMVSLNRHWANLRPWLHAWNKIPSHLSEACTAVNCGSLKNWTSVTKHDKTKWDRHTQI